MGDVITGSFWWYWELVFSSSLVLIGWICWIVLFFNEYRGRCLCFSKMGERSEKYDDIVGRGG